MKAAVFVKPGQWRSKNFLNLRLKNQPTRSLKFCAPVFVGQRGIVPRKGGTTVGHEAIGIVEEVGDAVTAVHPGDFVVAPFTHGCGRCAACLAGFDGDCLVPNEGAARIILMSHHEDRAKLGREFDATDIVSERGDEAVKHVMQLTNEHGADSVLEEYWLARWHCFCHDLRQENFVESSAGWRN